MHSSNVPALGIRYWVAISVASVFGANLGDFASHVLHLGHVRGLPILGLLFAGVVLAERRAVPGTEVWYWAAIILLRTAATNLADFGTHDLRLGYSWVVAGLAALLFLLSGSRSRAPGMTEGPRARGASDGVGAPGTGGLERAPRGGRALSPLPGSTIPSAPQTSDRYLADCWFWATMLVAGTLGTAFGDFTADGIGLGTGLGTVVLGIILVGVLAVGSRWNWTTPAAYWTSIVAVRCAGTTMGDFLVERGGLGLGLRAGTAVSGLLLVGTLLAWRRRRSIVASVYLNT